MDSSQVQRQGDRLKLSGELRLADGERLWTQLLAATEGPLPPHLVVDLEGAARGALAEVDNRLVAGLLDGRVVALEASGRRVWEQQLPRSVVSPAVASGSA